MANTDKDKLIDELIEITQKKKLEIEKAEKPSWLTNCTFGYDTTSLKINLRTISTISELVKILAFILNKEKDFKLANDILGTNEVFEWLGFSKDEWSSDIKTRVDQISITAKRKELENIEKQLDSLISKERREELQLQAIMKKLKGDI